MSEKIGQIPENNLEIYKSVEMQSQTTLQASAISLNVTVSNSSTNNKVDKLDIQSDEQLQQELEILLEDNGLSEEYCSNNIK